MLDEPVTLTQIFAAHTDRLPTVELPDPPPSGIIVGQHNSGHIEPAVNATVLPVNPDARAELVTDPAVAEQPEPQRQCAQQTAHAYQRYVACFADATQALLHLAHTAGIAVAYLDRGCIEPNAAARSPTSSGRNSCSGSEATTITSHTATPIPCTSTRSSPPPASHDTQATTQTRRRTT